jgi:hypothetical protein
MLRPIRALCLAASLIAGIVSASPAQACPMCKVALEEDPDPAAKARPKAYMYSILFMLSMPATLLTAFGVSFYRLSRKQSLINQAIAAEYSARNSDDAV